MGKWRGYGVELVNRISQAQGYKITQCHCRFRSAFERTVCCSSVIRDKQLTMDLGHRSMNPGQDMHDHILLPIW